MLRKVAELKFLARLKTHEIPLDPMTFRPSARPNFAGLVSRQLGIGQPRRWAASLTLIPVAYHKWCVELPQLSLEMDGNGVFGQVGFSFALRTTIA